MVWTLQLYYCLENLNSFFIKWLRLRCFAIFCRGRCYFCCQWLAHCSYSMLSEKHVPVKGHVYECQGNGLWPCWNLSGFWLMWACKILKLTLCLVIWQVAFCIHNIAYQGRFAFGDFSHLNLPDRFKSSFDFIDGYDTHIYIFSCYLESMLHTVLMDYFLRPWT